MGNQLQLTVKQLTDANGLRGMFELPSVVQNSVANYQKTRNVSIEQAQMVYEREKILFFKAIQSNPKLESCDRFTIYSSWIELMVSGLSLNEGQSYIIPRGNKAQFQIGYKGRLEQINMLPTIELAPEAQVVYMSDEFDYDLHPIPHINKHKPAKDRGKDPADLMTHCYLNLTETNGKDRLTIMQRHEILAIRDRYSEPYKNWKRNDGKWPDGKPMDLPIWLIAYDGKVVDNPAAFKKTVIGRTYSGLPKTPRMKALDESIKNNPDAEDPQTTETENVIDYGMDKVNTTTGEVIDTTHTEEREEQKPANNLPPILDTEAF